MAPAKTTGGQQSTLSSFFKRKDAPAAGGTDASAVADSHGKRGSNAAGASLPPVKKARQSIVESTPEQAKKARDRMGRWRFDPSSTDQSQSQSQSQFDRSLGIDEHQGETSMETDGLAERQEQERERAQRHEAFRRKLIGADNPLARRRLGAIADEDEVGRTDGEGATAGSTPMEVDEVENDGGRAPGEDEDEGEAGAIANPFSRFAASATDVSKSPSPAVSGQSAKGKAKATTKARGKSKEVDAGIKYTPLEKQVLEIKAANPGVLLIVEVGYKFRFFGEDARIAARELNVMAFPDKNMLSAMIPVHRLHIHIKKLITQGYKVGIVRQMETRALKAAGDNRSAPFTRALTQLYTASTWVDDLDSLDSLSKSFSSPTTPNTLVALVERLEGGSGVDERVSFGMVAVQPSTGDIVYDQFEDGYMRSELETRLAHLQPSEFLLQKDMSKPTEKMLRYIAGQTTTGKGEKIRVERVKDEGLSKYNAAFTAVSEFYQKEASMDENGEVLATVVNLPDQVIIALAALIKHLTAFGLESAFRLTKFFAPFASRSSMLLTGNTLTNLEIYRNSTNFAEKGSLLWILDHTKTIFGRRLLRKWIGRPLVDVEALQTRVDAVEECLSSTHPALDKLKGLLHGLPDLERGLARLNYGRSSPAELAQILVAFDRIAREFDPVGSPSEVGFSSSILNDAIAALPCLRGIVGRFLADINLVEARANNKADLFRDPGKYPEIQDTKDCLAVVEHDFKEHLVELRKLLRKPNLQYATVSGDDYLIEVRNTEAKKVPVNWVKHSNTKAVTRFRTPEVLRMLKERDQLREKLDAEAELAFKTFVSDVADQYEVFRNVITKLGIIDCLLSLSAVATLPGYVKPTFNEEGKIAIKNGRHPMVEALRDDPFVPNSVELGGDKERAMLITGPNMGGKSSCVRMVALLAIMAQIGSYVPAEQASFSMSDAILTRMGASDELAKGRSTFMVEMGETADILKTATKNSLVILDELGRGTSSCDGMATAYAVLNHLLHRVQSPKLLFITHFINLGAVVEEAKGIIVNKHMGFIEEKRLDGSTDITFLYKLRDGLASHSYGIEVGRTASLPPPLLERAQQKSIELENSHKSRLAANLVSSLFQTDTDANEDKMRTALSSAKSLLSNSHSVLL